MAVDRGEPVSEFWVAIDGEEAKVRMSGVDGGETTMKAETTFGKEKMNTYKKNYCKLDVILRTQPLTNKFQGIRSVTIINNYGQSRKGKNFTVHLAF